MNPDSVPSPSTSRRCRWHLNERFSFLRLFQTLVSKFGRTRTQDQSLVSKFDPNRTQDHKSLSALKISEPHIPPRLLNGEGAVDLGLAQVVRRHPQFVCNGPSSERVLSALAGKLVVVHNGAFGPQVSTSAVQLYLDDANTHTHGRDSQQMDAHRRAQAPAATE